MNDSAKYARRNLMSTQKGIKRYHRGSMQIYFNLANFYLQEKQWGVLSTK